jgi:NAD(P)-dependent dehydrogenase (short-subunit alcohol dehydrogenase family)
MAPRSAEFVVKETLDRFGRIDALVNIAGAVAGLDVFQMTTNNGIRAWNSNFTARAG